MYSVPTRFMQVVGVGDEAYGFMENLGDNVAHSVGGTIHCGSFTFTCADRSRRNAFLSKETKVSLPR